MSNLSSPHITTGISIRRFPYRTSQHGLPGARISRDAVQERNDINPNTADNESGRTPLNWTAGNGGTRELPSYRRSGWTWFPDAHQAFYVSYQQALLFQSPSRYQYPSPFQKGADALDIWSAPGAYISMSHCCHVIQAPHYQFFLIPPFAFIFRKVNTGENTAVLSQSSPRAKPWSFMGLGQTKAHPSAVQ